MPCTLDYPSEWWGVEVHGQMTDTDNPKTCTSFGHEPKSKTELWFVVSSTVHHSIELFHQPTLMHNFY